MTLEPLTLSYAQDLATMAARRTMQTWHVVDDGHYSIVDDRDVACWGSNVIWTVAPDQAFAFSPPGFPEDDDDSPDGGGPPRALPQCHNCHKAHFTWRCPEIGDLLLAEPVALVLDVEYAPCGWPVEI